MDGKVMKRTSIYNNLIQVEILKFVILHNRICKTVKHIFKEKPTCSYLNLSKRCRQGV